jgi:SAM-dependent methyltransferase
MTECRLAAMDDEPDPRVRPATPEEASDVRAMHAATRVAWDQAAERYERWLAEAVDLIRSGGTNLFGAEIELIGDLHGRCRRAIHLQCAAGRDSLSLWNLGADEVIGIDFSPRMLELARRLTAATGAPARWVCADVLDTPHDLDGTADLVYTGRGSVIWLQDLDAWAVVIARLLSPTGRFVLFEGHPIEWLFDVDEAGHWVATDYDYFAGPEASRGWAPEYIDRLTLPEADQSWKFARAWTLGEVITALLGAGLRLERVTEHPIDWWGGHGDARPEERGRIPLSFSVVGRRGDYSGG